MDDVPLSETIELEPAPSTEEGTTAPATPSRSLKSPLIVAAVVALLMGVCLCLCLCLGLCLVGCGTSSLQAMAEREPITAVIDAFMQAMADKDPESAYALFSTRAQRQVPYAKIEEMQEGANYVLFDGYIRVQLQTLNINAAANTDPNKPQGTVARAEGTVIYEGGHTGTFHAVLEQENGVWKLDGINVIVTPAKLSPTKEP